MESSTVTFCYPISNALRSIAFLGLHKNQNTLNDPEQAEILALFGAEQFIPTENSNYDAVEEIGREIGQIQ